MCNSAPTPVHTVTHTQVQCCQPFQQLHSIFRDLNNNTASQSVPEMEGIYATGGHPFQRLYLWWSLRTLYLLACELERLTSSVELAHATRVFVVVFVWRLNSER